MLLYCCCLAFDNEGDDNVNEGDDDVGCGVNNDNEVDVELDNWVCVVVVDTVDVPGKIATILTPFGVQTCDVFVVCKIVTLFMSWLLGAVNDGWVNGTNECSSWCCSMLWVVCDWLVVVTLICSLVGCGWQDVDIVATVTWLFWSFW